jgi:hypothetical protein
MSKFCKHIDSVIRIIEENDPNETRSAREKFIILWLATENFIERGRILPVS